MNQYCFLALVLLKQLSDMHVIYKHKFSYLLLLFNFMQYCISVCKYFHLVPVIHFINCIFIWYLSNKFFGLRFNLSALNVNQMNCCDIITRNFKFSISNQDKFHKPGMYFLF